MPWYKIGTAQTPAWRGKPPQMLPQDIPVWYEYLDRTKETYNKCYYNVAMTALDPSEIPGLKSMVEMWMYAVSKRVDVMAETRDHVDVIEVTRHAGIRSLGQIIAYGFLYDLCKPFRKPKRLKIVCIYSDPDVKLVAEKHGVEVIELEPRPLGQIIRTLAAGGE